MVMNPVGTLETAKATNPLTQLLTFGQSIWLDYIRRDLLKGGELQRLIEEDGLGGMTSNPTIFGKAIGESDEYQDFLDTFSNRTDLDAIFWTRSLIAPTSMPRAVMKCSLSVT